MADPFEEFGGKALLPTKEKEQDPFAEFGGTEIKAADPFSEFGGKSLEPEEGGLVVGKDVTPEEIREIAGKYGARPELLELFTPYYGGTVAGQGGLVSTARRGVGFISESLGGLPTFGAKKLLAENEQKALDELNKLVEQKKSTLQAGAELVGAVLTPTALAAKGLPKLAAAGIGAAEGAAFGLGESKTGEEALSAGIGAAGGALAGPVAAVVGKGIGKLISKGEKAEKEIVGTTIDALRKDATPDTIKILDEVEAIVTPKLEGWKAEAKELLDIPAELTPQLRQTIQDFSESIGGKRNVPEAIEVINDYKSRLSPDDFEKAFTRWKTGEAVGDALERLAVEEPAIKTKLRDGVNTIIDNMSVARDIDNRRGTNFNGLFLEATKRINEYQAELAGFLRKKIDASSSYDNLSEPAKETLYKALTGSGEFKDMTEEAIKSSLPKDLQSGFTAWRGIFDSSRERANKLGVPIMKRANYLPDQMLDIPNTIMVLEKKIAEAAKEAGINPLKLAQDFDVKSFANPPKDAPASAMNELYRAVTYLTGEAPDTADKFSTALRQALQPGGDVYSKEIKASALFQRTGLLPDFLKEKDISKLANKWGQQVYRYSYMKDVLADIKQQAAFLRKAGAIGDAEKMERTYDEYLGQTRFLAKATRQAKLAAQVKLLRLVDRAEVPAVKKFYEWMAKAPDAIQNGVLNVYPNFLGLSPRAIIQNLTGGLYMMVPEMGNIYGTKAIIPAYLRALKNIGSKSYWAKLEEEGFVAPQWSTDLKEAIRSGKPPGMPARVADRVANLVMAGFEWSERMNRAVAYESGKILAKDAVAGNKRAMEFVKNMPERLSREVTKAINAGDPKAAQQLVTRYIADRTLFSYNRISSSEISRAVGPLFSMFTKYPSAIAGRTVEAFRERGAIKGGQELLRFTAAPLVFGSAINALLFEPGSEAERIMFGEFKDDTPIWARGAASSSPLYAVKSVLEGRMFNPPVVATTKETLLGGYDLMAQGDPDRLGRAIKKGVEAFTPGGIPAIAKLYEQVTELMGEGKDFPYLGKEE